MKSWGFDGGQIRTETHVWCGALDETVPAAVGAWLANQIPDSALTTWPEHGHFTWMSSAEAAEVVGTISA